MSAKRSKPSLAKAAPGVVLMSLWRDDEGREIERRIEHLLSKQGVTRWVWVVGNSSDGTERILRETAERDPRVTVIRFDSDVLGDTPNERLVRLSQTASAGLDTVKTEDAYWCIHEGDLESPSDLIPRFLAMQADGAKVCAGWVILGDIFYDTYAYRNMAGMMFTNGRPFSDCYREDRPFEVSSAGSVLFFPAQPLRDGVRMERGGVVELCRKLRDMGLTIWVDPSLHIYQPVHLWTPANHADY